VVAEQIEGALLERGVQAISIAQEVEDQQALGRGLNRVFQAFMALGLFVGVAALGVIVSRSVVERRQQIGMLRAIGYQRGTVALSFLLESSFVALAGIGAGIVGAVIIARQTFTDGELGEEAARNFFVPWVEVGIFAALAFGFSLFMTWWPSRAAARTPIAEAMRYE
jgi:putative ABC transport system permease protein